MILWFSMFVHANEKKWHMCLATLKQVFVDFQHLKPFFFYVFTTRPVFHWACPSHPLLTVAPVLTVHAFCIPFHTANRYLIVTRWQRRERLCRARPQYKCNWKNCVFWKTQSAVCINHHRYSNINRLYQRGRSVCKTHIHSIPAFNVKM